jgi:PAS domain S-box-containing protein
MEPFPPLLRFLEASSSPVVVTDALAPDQPIVLVNPAFEAMSGYRRGDVVGRNCRFLQGDDRDQPARGVIAAALAAGRPCECELRNYRKDGTLFWNRLYLFPLQDDGGRITHVAGIQHDISAEKAAYARLEALAAERADLIRQLERKRTHMARLSHGLIQAQETERKQVARELHEEIAQRLAALQLELYRARPCFDAGGAAALWQEAESGIVALVSLARSMSVSLRPPSLDDFGLEPTIRQLLARQFAGGPEWVFEYVGLPDRLAPLVEITVFRIVHESVSNIVRHARAARAVVEIVGDPDDTTLELIVRDDGAGFDAARWRARTHGDAHGGLAIIGERVELLGGSFDVSSSPGAGTRVTATLPLAPRLTGPAAEPSA